jgi:hypothetical protein
MGEGLSGISYQLSAISYQLSGISYYLLATHDSPTFFSTNRLPGSLGRSAIICRACLAAIAQGQCASLRGTAVAGGHES